MRYIEPIYDEFWDEDREEFICSDTLIAYRVVSERGEVLGVGETREEALERAQKYFLLPA